MTESQSPLESLHIATPCPADWNAMTGDEQVRFCGQCQMNVYNLSSMTRQAAEDLLRNREGRLCVQYFRRHDGTVITRDCPVGIKALHRRRIRAVLAGTAAAVTLITAVGAFTVNNLADAGSNSLQPAETRGAPSPPVRLGGEAVALPRHVMGSPPPPEHIMGDYAEPQGLPKMGDVRPTGNPPPGQENQEEDKVQCLPSQDK